MDQKMDQKMDIRMDIRNETKVSVSDRHREEWASFRERYVNPLLTDEGAADLEGAKFAKAFADILKVTQEGERKAWGFADGEIDSTVEMAWEGTN